MIGEGRCPSDCEYCKRTNDELAQYIDMSNVAKKSAQVKRFHQYACAEHHIERHHGGIQDKQMEFFAGREETRWAIAVATNAAFYEKQADAEEVVHKRLLNWMESHTHSPGVVMELHTAMHEIANVSATEISTRALHSIAMSVYITSGGSHCLWGLIDPALCKEASSE